MASSSRPLRVLGAGGHAKVVIATARAAGYGEITIHDDDASRAGEELLGARVVGPVAGVIEDVRALAVLAIGDNATRHRLGALARCELATLVHPRAHVEASVVLGAGTVVFAGAIIQPDARLGTNVIVNTMASIDHDCILGDSVHVAPGTHVAGNVTLGEGVFLGIGTVVIPGRTVGAWTNVGAGAAIVRDLPGGITAIGVPARQR
jgi:sugar O-acyltransferase (sialic acid O-acetyltransferase NeuD family)